MESRAREFWELEYAGLSATRRNFVPPSSQHSSQAYALQTMHLGSPLGLAAPVCAREGACFVVRVVHQAVRERSDRQALIMARRYCYSVRRARDSVSPLAYSLPLLCITGAPADRIGVLSRCKLDLRSWMVLGSLRAGNLQRSGGDYGAQPLPLTPVV